MSRLLDGSIAVSNRLVDLSAWLENRGHPNVAARVIRLRGWFDRLMCKVVLGHPRIIHGAVRDICLDCLTIVDEHPHGRGRDA